jgi:hypothetical protein
MSNALQRLEIPGGASDAEVLTQVKRRLREAHGSAALIVTGSFAGNVEDVNAYRDLIGLLTDAAIPVFALPSGSVGQRGLAFLLTADHTFLGQEASLSADWRTCPGLAPLLHYRLGSMLARAVVFDPSADLLMQLAKHGLATCVDNPAVHLKEIAAILGDGAGRRLKRSLRAADELPLKEAFGFDLWFSRSQHASAP